jgi:small subunit ribosomal protein S6
VTKYEILLLLDPDLDDNRQGEILGRVRDLVEKGDGTWDFQDAWGRRRLAYEIGHKAEGTYHLLHFTSEPATLDEISRVLRIDDGVMRHMATRRIEGSPARPVAVAPPARQDSEASESKPTDSEPAESESRRPEVDSVEDSGGGPESAPEAAAPEEE